MSKLTHGYAGLPPSAQGFAGLPVEQPPRPDVRAELEAVMQEMRDWSAETVGTTDGKKLLTWADALAALAARLGER